MGKIALNMIVRNASRSVREALDSTKGAVDYYVIGFAGKSTDLTREAVVGWLKENGLLNMASLSEFEFVDFADARNRVLDATPDEADWILWLDADDIILGADELRSVVETVEREGAGCVQFPYIYMQDEQGNPLVVHDRERLVKRNLGWRWFRPVHETLNTMTPHQVVRLNNLTWVHKHAVGEHERSKRNLDLLLRYYNENPEDLRTFSYLAHAYFSLRNWTQAIDWFYQAYQQPVNSLEKWQSAVFLARCWFQLDRFEEAVGWCWQAVDVEPRIADPYLVAAACYVMMGEGEKAHEFYRIADDKKAAPSVLFVLPGEYTFNRWCYEHRALAQVGDIEGALAVCKKALEYSPGHFGFLYYAEGYMEALDIQRTKGALAQIVFHLQKRGDALAAVEVLAKAPKNIIDDDDYQEMLTAAQRRVEHLFNEAAFEQVYGEGCNVEKTNLAWDLLLTWDCLNEPRFRAVYDLVMKYQGRMAKRGERLSVIDLGCGDGLLAVTLAQAGCLVTGIDSVPGNVLRAQRLAEAKGVAEHTRFVCSQIEKLDLNEIGQHDLAICMEIIEHVQNPAMILGTGLDIANVVVFSTPHAQVGREHVSLAPDGIHQYHVREYHFLDLLRLAVASGGRIENLTTVYMPESNEGHTLPGYGTWVGEIVKQQKTRPAVVFYLGGSLEKWSPETIDNGGIGGSETAVIQMARLFSLAGHLTFVYGPVDGVWDGVIYRNTKRFVPQSPAMGNPCLLFVSSRVPEVFDKPVDALIKAIWFHDWDYGYPGPVGRLERLTPERAEQIDTLFVLSDAQKRYFEETYPFLENRLTVTSNGIDPGRFEGLEAIERQRHRFIWSNSPDRGLDRVLRMWPHIQEFWPDAELHVFYGFQNMEAFADRLTSKGLDILRLQNTMEDIPGVFNRGRIGQRELAEEFARSQFWFYPTSFTETYCITANEAMGAGCTPVTSSVAALAERVPERFRLHADACDEEYIEVLRDLDRLAAAGVPNGMVTPQECDRARSMTWKMVFRQWYKLMNEVFARKREERNVDNTGEPENENRATDGGR